MKVIGHAHVLQRSARLLYSQSQLGCAYIYIFTAGTSVFAAVLTSAPSVTFARSATPTSSASQALRTSKHRPLEEVISDTMYMHIWTLVLGDKFTYDRYYGSHSNFKPKQVDTVSLTSKTFTAKELQAIKDKNWTQR